MAFLLGRAAEHKRIHCENNLKNPTVSLIEEYQSYDTRVIEDNEKYKQPVPKSLIPLKEKIELLDFKISNNVQGLLKYGDIEGAKEYLKRNYLPDSHQIKKILIVQKKRRLIHLIHYQIHCLSLLKIHYFYY